MQLEIRPKYRSWQNGLHGVKSVLWSDHRGIHVSPELFAARICEASQRGAICRITAPVHYEKSRSQQALCSRLLYTVDLKWLNSDEIPRTQIAETPLDISSQQYDIPMP